MLFDIILNVSIKALERPLQRHSIGDEMYQCYSSTRLYQDFSNPCRCKNFSKIKQYDLSRVEERINIPTSAKDRQSRKFLRSTPSTTCSSPIEAKLSLVSSFCRQCSSYGVRATIALGALPRVSIGALLDGL